MIALPRYTPPLRLPARAQTMRVFSYGGGVQSNAVLVLQAQGKLPNSYDVFVFSNVGADSENPATLEYVEHVAKPFAAEHGVPFVEVQKLRYGEPETLFERINRSKRSVPIPMYMGGNGAPGNRKCTMDFKIRVVDKWIKAQNITYVTVGLGISLDEATRMRDQQWHDAYGKKKYGFWKRRDYPLIDLRMRRNDCRTVTREAGLPDAPKSSCWFCPFRRSSEWVEMKRERPELFQRAVVLEQHIHEVRGLIGRDNVFIHRSLVPLDQAVGDQLPLFPEWDMDNCESGYCFV